MKALTVSLGLVLALASPATADSKVVLTRGLAAFETTIPGNFNSLEAILPALFTLADQAGDKGVEQIYVGVMKDCKDLIYYYRGVRIEGETVILSFTKGAMPYFSGPVGQHVPLMASLHGTVRLYQPNAKRVALEIDGKPYKNEDA